MLLNGLTQRKIDLISHKFTLFVNNLGGVSPLEMTFLSGVALDKLKELGVKVSHVAVGPFMTSLDMNGISLSLSAVKANEENPLLGKTGAPAWPELNAVSDGDFLIPLDMPADKVFEGAKLSAEVKAKITAAMKAVSDMEPQLTEWDQKSGDGDCGQTFKKGADAILADLDSYPEDPASLCQAVARTISYSMGGSSGVLLAMFFESAAASIKGADSALLAGFRGGVDSIMHYGGAKVGSCTMVDALSPAKEGQNLKEIADKAMAGANTTS